MSSGYIRFPTLHQETVVFCADGDLWQVSAGGGQARRLTTTGAEASHPRLSPDGSAVAFVGSVDGSTEVYVRPIPEGPVRRRTYQGAPCTVVGWHPQTGEILYASTAGQPFGAAWLYAVDPLDGPPRPLRLGPAHTIAYRPDGATVLARGVPHPAHWKRYRGGAAGELWLDPTGAGRFHRIPTSAGNPTSPCWIGDRIFFLADHEGRGNVYSCLPGGDDLCRHSNHIDFYARFLSGDGERLVYCAGGELYLLSPSTAEPTRVEVSLTGTGTQLGRRFVPASTRVDSVVYGRKTTRCTGSTPVHESG